MQIEFTMMEVIAGVLLILWSLGVVAFPDAGDFIHVLLLAAVLVVLVRVARGSST